MSQLSPEYPSLHWQEKAVELILVHWPPFLQGLIAQGSAKHISKILLMHNFCTESIIIKKTTSIICSDLELISLFIYKSLKIVIQINDTFTIVHYLS